MPLGIPKTQFVLPYFMFLSYLNDVKLNKLLIFKSFLATSPETSVQNESRIVCFADVMSQGLVTDHFTMEINNALKLKNHCVIII